MYQNSKLKGWYSAVKRFKQKLLPGLVIDFLFYVQGDFNSGRNFTIYETLVTCKS